MPQVTEGKAKITADGLVQKDKLTVFTVTGGQKKVAADGLVSKVKLVVF